MGDKSSFWRAVLSKKSYWLSFIIPAAILFAAYAAFRIYPFGVKSVLALDLNAQYVCYYDYMYDVFGGKESIFYCWSGSLSGEFFGTFAYYLASPFNFIIWLFPRECITEGILVMLLVKSGAVGLSASFYLKMHRKFSDCTAILFSVMFALCGYFVAHTINPMWLDGLVALPLVIMGVERICEKRGFLLYTLSLLYIFLANYYIGYMVGIFSALYIIYFVSSRKIGGVKDYFRTAGVYALSSVSAVLMSCFVIIPVFKSLQNGKIGNIADFTPKENFNFADAFVKLFPGIYDTERPDGLPMLYCGTLALIFVVIYFICSKISLRKRVGGGFLLGVMALSMYIKPVDMLWHGGQVPVWMPYRYSFAIIFLLIIFGAEAFDNIEKVSTKQIGTAFFVLLGVLLFCDYFGGGEHFDTALVIVVPVVFLGIIAAFALGWKKYHSTNVMKGFISAVVCIELFTNAVMYIYKINDDVYYSERSSYADEIPETRNIVNQIKSQDSGFYRLEKTYHRTVNDPMATGLYGFSHSTSTYNSKVIKLLSDLGFGARDHYSRYDGATMLTDDIFGVKYVISKDSRFAQYSEEISVQNKFGAQVNVNTDALPIAYLADEKAIGSTIDYESPFLFQQRLAGILMGRNYTEDPQIFTKINDIVFDNKNITIGSTVDGYYSYKKRYEKEDAWVSYSVIMPKSGVAYVYLPTIYERECKLYLNGEYLKNYFQNENHCIVYLGEYESGEELKIELKPNQEIILKDPEFYVLDKEILSEFTSEMRSQYCEVNKTEFSSFEIKVNAEENCALFTTIPFEDGWTATIDGGECTIASAVNKTLLSLSVPSGEHTIILSFFPAGLKTGLILTACGAGLLAVMIIVRFTVRHKRKKSAELSDNSEENTETIPEFPEIPETDEDDMMFVQKTVSYEVSEPPVIPENDIDEEN